MPGGGHSLTSGCRNTERRHEQAKYAKPPSSTDQPRQTGSAFIMLFGSYSLSYEDRGARNMIASPLTGLAITG